MPRLSMYRPNKTNDFKFFDRTIKERFTVGGLDIHIHMYAGVKSLAGGTGDATQPTYDETNPLFIEDLLLLENRNREYDDNIRTLRGVYNVQDIDFDLSQFGIFLQNDTLFISFHYNQMIDFLGRKLMNGDVLEIPNLTDFHPLNPDVPKGLPKYYVINDASFSAEGFGPTWLPHVWRVKAVPLVGSQEYKDILDQFVDNDGGINGDDGEGNGSGTLADYMCQHAKNIDINDAIITQAEEELPLSGYDVDKFYITEEPDEDSDNVTWITADNNIFTVDSDQTVDIGKIPTCRTTIGYLTGDGIPPNGMRVTPSVTFPVNPVDGDFVLRLDYKPNRLFQYTGSTWIHIEDNVRTNLTPGAPDNLTHRSGFTNNTDMIETNDRGDIPSRQSLSKLLEPKSDN